MISPIDVQILAAICRRAGALATSAVRGPFESKGDGSPVTEADRAVERQIARELRDWTPDIPMVGEEGGGQIAAEGLAWVVDPIDGTGAYLAGLPTWGVSVGLLRDGVPVVGCLHMPTLGPEGETFLGGEGVPLTRGGRPATAVTPTSAVQVCALVPSDVHRRYSLALPGRVRSLGSTAYHLALVATGSALAALLHETYPWDVAGVMPMLARADVIAATLDGAALDLRGHLDGSRIEGPMLVAPRWAWASLVPMIQPLPTGEPVAAVPPPCGG
jgi:myo-inositol-1(or 4)-monophosphatase